MNAFFNLSALRRLVYLLLSIGLAIYFAEQFAFEDQVVWLIIATLFFGGYVIGYTFLQFIITIVLSGLLGALSVGIFSYLTIWPMSWFIAFSVAVFVFTIIAEAFPRYAFVCLTLNILILLTFQMFPIDQTEIATRVLFILGAMVITLLSALTLFPYFLKHNIHSTIRNYLRHLHKLNNEIFSCFLDPNYPDELYLYERRLNLEKQQLNNILKYLSHLSCYIKNPEKKDNFEKCLTHLRNIYAALLNVSQLRWQVSDHSIFRICSDELKFIQANINAVMFQTKNISALKDAIQRFEGIFQKVLQVTAREPVVFLFFIDSLQSLAKQFELDKRCDI